MKVIFICRRNRFRSQIAEGIFNYLVKDGSRAISAGIDTLPEEHSVLFGEYKNEKVKNTIEAMKNYGIDISRKHAKPVTPEMLVDADKVIFVTEKEEIPEWFNKYSYEHWEVKNFPGSPTLEKSEETIKILEDKIRNLLNK